MRSQSVEDYLKIIYKLTANSKRASTKTIAEKMNVAQASVTGMLKKLSEINLIHYSPYKEVQLTDAGEKIALEMIRHHRLLELYLKEAMGYSWDQVHEEAEHLEHHISEEFEEKIDALLGRPTEDPHGAPIPTKDGKIADAASNALTEFEVGAHLIIRRVSDDDPEKLRYLAEHRLFPKAEIKILSKEPFNGPVQIAIEGQRIYLGKEITDSIFVEEVS